MMNLLEQVEEFNFDGQSIFSNCVCKECGKIFDKKGGKDRHVKNVHSKHLKISNHANALLVKPEKEEIKVEVDPIMSIKSEPCDNAEEINDLKENKCENESFLVNNVQVNDLIKQETDSQDIRFESEFSCDLCDNTLSSKESLDIHKLIHAELNRFLCKEKCLKQT